MVMLPLPSTTPPPAFLQYASYLFEFYSRHSIIAYFFGNELKVYLIVIQLVTLSRSGGDSVTASVAFIAH